MSIQTEITRLNTAKANILTSISNKGVDTSSVNTLNDIPPLIDSISTKEDLSNELNEQNTLLSNQEVTIEDIKLALQGKGSGGEVILQEKTITPTTSQQNVVADSGYNGLSRVVVNAVDSSIDSDIKATNIRKGIDILGVTGTLEEGITPSGTLDITENGTYDVTEYASANVNCPTGDTSIEDGLITRTLTTYSNSRVTKIGDNVFTGFTTIKSFDLPNVTEIGDSAFSSCTFSSIDLPKVVSVGSSAFQYSNLTSIDLPNAKTIGSSAFRQCPSLTTWRADNVTSIGGSCFRNSPKLSNVTIPKGVTTIASTTFYSCSSLAKLDLPENLSSIQGNALQGCSTLATLIVRKSNGVCTLGGALTGTPIANGTGYIYVPDNLVDSYKTATNWSTYADQFRAIEDYPDICG